MLAKVEDVQKVAGGSVFVHSVEVQAGTISKGQTLTAQVRGSVWGGVVGGGCEGGLR